MPILNRTASDTVYRPGKPLAVMVRVIPSTGTLAYGIEETPPVGWAISNITLQGNYVGGMIKWGPFFDGNPRDFNYVAVPPLNATANGVFDGRVSFDGASSTIGGFKIVPKDSVRPASPI